MKHGKKYLVIYIMVITGALTVGGCVLLITMTFYKPPAANIPNSQSQVYQNAGNTSSDTVSEPQTQEDYLFCVKLENGKIVVYKKGEQTPFETLDTDPAVLPDKDKDDLKNGIYLKTESELKRLIEDFDG